MFPNLSMPCPAVQPRRLSAPQDRVCFFSVPALQPSQLPFAALFALLEQCRARDLGHGGVRGRAAGCDGGRDRGCGGQQASPQAAGSLAAPQLGTGTDSPEQFITASSVVRASAVNMSHRKSCHLVFKA